MWSRQRRITFLKLLSIPARSSVSPPRSAMRLAVLAKAREREAVLRLGLVLRLRDDDEAPADRDHRAADAHTA